LRLRLVPDFLRFLRLVTDFLRFLRFLRLLDDFLRLLDDFLRLLDDFLRLRRLPPVNLAVKTLRKLAIYNIYV